jgi:hypothetical protein
MRVRIIGKIASDVILFGGKTGLLSNESGNKYVYSKYDCADRKYANKIVCHKMDKLVSSKNNFE